MRTSLFCEAGSVLVHTAQSTLLLKMPAAAILTTWGQVLYELNLG